jgi:cyanamide hydratase family protein with HD domain
VDRLSARRPVPPLPTRISDIPVPQDDVSAATWRWAHRSLPDYLLTHSVRSYCWGAAIAAGEGWTFDGQILWAASLMHDVGLRTTSKNTMCFEVEGAEIARRFLEGAGLRREVADRVATAIVLHMQPAVTLTDGVESVLLDRATGLDVRGVDYALVDAVRPQVMRDFPRRAFDRHFLAAIAREAAIRPTCQSARLLHQTGLAEWMTRSPWAVTRTPRRGSRP